MPQRVRRLSPVALAALVVVALMPAPAAATDDLSAPQAEQRVLALINEQRAAVGRVALRHDPRLTVIARARSNDMAAKDYFAHQQPDGRWAWDLITAAGITWYGAGENLAFNYWGTLAESAAGAARQWHDSPSHYGLLTSADFNYVGIGLAVDGDGRKIWTAVFLKGPDRTRPLARMRSASRGSTYLVNGTRYRRVTVRWWGADVRLSVLTAGLRSFQVQKRRPGGTWRTVIASTVRGYSTFSLRAGRTFEFRVRSRDRAGNWGAWTAPQRLRS
ncbi:MAG TPA: CAP domain-containing protein [Candidatus Limnocylindrales bacterium]|nr:CAP domain-containing protein [Candidatus Limnocylindrales bacterium]